MKINQIVGIILVALAILAFYFSMKILPKEMTDDFPIEATQGDEDTIIRLHDAELAAAGITIEKASVNKLRSIRTLPGRIVYDQTKHVAVRAAADGVIESLAVQPGDSVEMGQLLGILRCPAVGMARSELMSRESAFAIAEKEHSWRSDIYSGVSSIVDLILQGVSVSVIEQQIGQQRLGQYRASLLNAYSQKIKAENLVRAAEQMSGTGVLSGRVEAERKNVYLQNSASLDALIEQSLFESQQSYKETLAAVESAKRRVDVARQELLTLMGITADKNKRRNLIPEGTDLSRLEVCSPIAGTIETREYSATERITAGDELFVVADTKHLWVEADIRGGDWATLQISEGDTVQVTTPATGDLALPAIVRYLGRQVDPFSGSVPLVAELSNTEGILRPGLFARIEAPTSAESEVLVIPESAIVDVNGKATIYLPEQEGFRPVEVKQGRRFGNQIEILAPLKEEQPVVVTGAFFLKSEQLLEGEE